jgi:hypothetical protein
MTETKTRIKILPTILKFLIGAFGLYMLTTLAEFGEKLISNPTGFNFVSVLMASVLGFFFAGLGLSSIKTFSTDGKFLTENILGLIKIRTDLKEIDCYYIRQASNAFGTFDQLMLNKRDGQTIIIESYDQKDFKDLRLEIEKLLTLDFKAKPNYWTKFYKVSAIMMGIWIGIMLIFMAIGK